MMAMLEAMDFALRCRLHLMCLLLPPQALRSHKVMTPTFKNSAHSSGLLAMLKDV